eukprot:2538551-Amphidinium_carterae.1
MHKTDKKRQQKANKTTKTCQNSIIVLQNPRKLCRLTSRGCDWTVLPKALLAAMYTVMEVLTSTLRISYCNSLETEDLPPPLPNPK